MPKAKTILSADTARGGDIILHSGPERAIFIGGLCLSILFAITLTGLALTIPNL